MVATLPAQKAPQSEALKTKALFPYLKPCPPAPGIATPAKTTEACAVTTCWQPAPLGKRQRRWLKGAFGLTQGIAIGLGLWLPSLWQHSPPVAVEENRERTTQQLAQTSLWQALGSKALSETLASTQQVAQEKQIHEHLAAAEQARFQAQQLRIDAENKAQNLTTEAKNQARRTTVDAIRQATLIHLDSTFIGAEQIINGTPEDEVTLKFTARIQCQAGAFGETAIATPVDTRIATREIRNLASCYPSSETATGEPIGEIGEWPIAFLKREPG